MVVKLVNNKSLHALNQIQMSYNETVVEIGGFINESLYGLKATTRERRKEGR
jgi:hypothetical protein